MQTMINVKDPAVRRIRDAATNRALACTLPAVIQRENDLVKLDAHWRAQIEKEISELVRSARVHRKAVRGIDEYLKGKSLGISVGYMAAARRLKSLLLIFWLMWFFQQPKRDCVLRWAPELKPSQPTRGCHR